jgi:thiol-disulfide isomerase/thioredoxin
LDEKGQPVQSARTFAEAQANLFANGFSFSGYERDLVALNLGDGKFLDISGITGADSVNDGRGSVFADFDNDGDQDIFLRAMHGEAHHLFRNNVGADSGFVRVALRGTESGRDAFGAEVRLGTSSGVLTKIKAGGSGFVSQSDPRLLFGLGSDKSAKWLEVTWPSGLKQRFAGPASGASLLIVEGDPSPRIVPEKRWSLPEPLGAEKRRWHTLGLDPKRPVADVTVNLLDGTTRRLSELAGEGETLLVNLWATWCRPCAREMPELERIHRRPGGHIRVVGLNVEPDQEAARIRTFVERTAVTYPIARIDPEALQQLLGTADPGIPISLVLDDKLRPRELLIGWSENTERVLDQLAGNGN